MSESERIKLNHRDVIIVGGGLAGLYAARKLEEMKISYRLFEAKNQFGGRIYGSASLAQSNHFYDLGPTWIFPHQSKIQRLVSELDVDVFHQYTAGDMLYHATGSSKPQRVAPAGDMRLIRIKGGMLQLINALQKPLQQDNLQLSSPVTAIKREHSRWQLEIVQTNTIQQYSADHLLLALPPRIIAESLSADQWASENLLRQLTGSQTWMSAQAKFVVSYAKPFWRESGLSGQTFSQMGPMMEIHDASTEDNGGYGLFGFLGWSVHRRTQLKPEQLKQACLDQLEALYGSKARNYETCDLKDWAKDEWITTRKDIGEPSQHPRIQISQCHAETQAKQLYFAGSEFGRADPGYLEGAVDAVDIALESLAKNYLNA